MLKLRIIPLLLIDGPNLVKGSGFDNWRRVGTLIPALNVHNSRDVDELLLVDAGASRNGRPFNLNILRQARGRCFVPLSVGGGLSTINEASAAIESGADKVVIGSALSSSMSLLTEVADRFGAQAAVAALDVRRTSDGWQMFTHGGSRLVEGSVVERARLAEEAGAGEIVINSIDRDGMM
ncbi:MAG: HisA/HisF-related TIM barrel protein, partial [Ilumatobacteraceae bacterium]